MNHLKQLVDHFFEWHRKEFLTSLALNIVFGILFQLFDLYDFIEISIVAALGIKSMYFALHFTATPGLRASHTTFSWKYFQSLPIARETLVLGFGVLRLIAVIPLFIWSLCFFPLVIQFLGAVDEVTIIGVVRVYISALIFFFAVGTNSVIHAINYPRKQFQDRFVKERTIVMIRVVSMMVVIAMYFIIIGTVIEQRYDYRIWIIFKYLGEGIKFVFETWALPVAMVLLCYVSFRRTLKMWAKESLSYREIVINEKKEFSIIAICVLMVAIPILSIDMVTPNKYRGHLVLKAIYRNDVESFNAYLNDPTALNYTNDYGYNSALTAISVGNTEMFKQIVKKVGIDYSHKVELGRDSKYSGLGPLELAVEKGRDDIAIYMISNGAIVNQVDSQGVTSLHRAMSKCYMRISDVLLMKHPEVVNLKDKNGNTPLHYAAASKCAFGVTLLKNYNADFSAKNKKGQTPLKLSLDKKLETKLSHYFLKKFSMN